MDDFLSASLVGGRGGLPLFTKSKKTSRVSLNKFKTGTRFTRSEKGNGNFIGSKFLEVSSKTVFKIVKKTGENSNFLSPFPQQPGKARPVDFK